MKGDLTESIDLEQLPPAYRKILKDIEAKFKANRSPSGQQKLLDKFSSNYLMPKELWRKLIELYLYNIKNGSTAGTQLENLRQRALYQFYYDRKNKIHDEFKSFYCNRSDLRKLLITDPKLDKYKSIGIPFVRMKEQQLSYPHQALDDVFKFYERYTYSTPSTLLIKTYRNMNQLYFEIKAVENNIEKWFQKLLESNDPQFVIHNMEYRLGRNLNNVKLWKLYIEYLKDTDPKEMLQLFSKYCRYFVDDTEMMEKYKSEVARYGPVFVKWNNPFDFERKKTPNFEKMVNPFISCLDRPINVCWLPESNCHIYIDDTYIYQSFSLPNTIIYYMLKHSNYSTLQKLHMSCKYFFAKMATPVCYNFEYHCSNEHRVRFAYQSIKLRTRVNNLDNIKPFYIANSLKLYCKSQGIQNLIQRLGRCEPKHIKIKEQFLNEKEFEYLVGHGNVETLSLKKVQVHDVNGVMVPLEDIMAKIPKISELRLDHVRVTSETTKILCDLPFENKIKSLKIFRINNLLNLDEFFGFINNIVHSQARLDFSCSDDAGDDFVWEFKRHKHLFERFWQSRKPKPTMAVFSSFEHEMLNHI